MVPRILFFIVFLLSATAEAKVLTVAMGSNLAPMHFLDPEGKLQGFEVELVTLYAREIGHTVSFLDPGTVNMSSSDMVASGKADLAVNCISITDERKKTVTFSTPYFTSGAALLVRLGSTRKDLSFSTFITIKGSIYHKLLLENQSVKIKAARNFNEAVALLKLADPGDAAIVFDFLKLAQLAKTDPDIKLHQFMLAREDYGAAFRSPADAVEWNAFLDRIRKDGRYVRLHQKWLGGIQLPEVRGLAGVDMQNKGLMQETWEPLSRQVVLNFDDPVSESATQVKFTISRPDGSEVVIASGRNAEHPHMTLQLFKSALGEPTKIQINEARGFLKAMTAAGEVSLKVVNVQTGVIASVRFPGHLRYRGLSPDMKAVMLDYDQLRFFLDLSTNTIFRIGLADRSDKKDADAAARQALYAQTGLQPAVIGKTGAGDNYYVAGVAGVPGQWEIYLQDRKAGKVVKKGVFLHNGIVERSQFLLDEKLFISHLGYDSCLPLNIVDVETGLKLDAGPCGGILQVGAHELYYCSGEGSFIINTGTLERRSLQRLPCPGKTGELYPHPLPGHFIFISAPLC